MNKIVFDNEKAQFWAALIAEKDNLIMQKDNLIMLNSAIDIFDECGKAQGKFRELFNALAGVQADASLPRSMSTNNKRQQPQSYVAVAEYEYDNPEQQLTAEEKKFEDADALCQLDHVKKFSLGHNFEECIDAKAFNDLSVDDARVEAIADAWQKLLCSDRAYHVKHRSEPITTRQLFVQLCEATESSVFQPKYFETQRTQPFVNLLLLKALPFLQKLVANDDKRKLMLWCEAKFDQKDNVTNEHATFGRLAPSTCCSDQSLFLRHKTDRRDVYDDFDRANAVVTVECKRTLVSDTDTTKIHHPMCEQALLGGERDALFVSGRRVGHQMRRHHVILTDGVVFYRARVHWTYTGYWQRMVKLSSCTSLRPENGKAEIAQLKSVARLFVGSVLDGLKCEFEPTSCLQSVTFRDQQLSLVKCLNNDLKRVIAKWQVVDGNKSSNFVVKAHVFSRRMSSERLMREIEVVQKLQQMTSGNNDSALSHLPLPLSLSVLRLRVEFSDQLLVYHDGGEPLTAQFVGGEDGERLADIFEKCILNGALPYCTDLDLCTTTCMMAMSYMTEQIICH